MNDKNSPDDIAYWMEREAAEKLLAASASTQASRDRHDGLAEHCADKAWSIAENDPEAPYLATSLWSSTRTPSKGAKAGECEASPC